ncbi:hypothetical protein [Ramlibacter sp. WS9]|uniref:hypothetical protein n=1 Tax=Ramlibacter sp. WS9 TaxID=1882741 RepID=UPI001141D485|nr:hypothetical protein [Ramlibacter sp. WS9]
MATIVLPGGTDVAEVAIFSLDSLPDVATDSDAVDSIVQSGELVRFPTGADGAYLLHAYVDEAIPEDIYQYCAKEDAVRGRLFLASGRIGFGGIESTFSAFKSNANIRSDGQVPPGDYALTAFHAEFPDDLVEKAVAAAIGRKGQLLLWLPSVVIPLAIVLGMIALFFKGPLGALTVAAVTVLGLKFGYFSNSTIRRLDEQNSRVSLAFPSIVVEMRSRNASEA